MRAFRGAADHKLDFALRGQKHSFIAIFFFPEPTLPEASGVARHNREGLGADQRGFEYDVSYQPDWLKLVKVTRQLESGRQSTKTLFRNPLMRPEAEPGDRIRTRITSSDQSLDFEVALTDPRSAVKRVRIAYEVPGENGRIEEVEFTLESEAPRDE